MLRARFLALEANKAVFNMAVDEYLLKLHQKTCLPSLRFYTWEPSAATIGRNQSLEEELDLEFCQAHSIDYTRRITGGGAVFHSNSGEITYSIVTSKKILNRAYSRLDSTGFPLQKEIPRYYVPILHALSLGLKSFGIDIDLSKLNCPALFLGGKKISGNAQLIRGNSVLQHGTILLDVEPELMYQVLRVPQGKTRTNIVRSVKAKVTGLNPHLSKKCLQNAQTTTPRPFSSFSLTLTGALKKAFESTLNLLFKPEPLTESEFEAARQIAEEKYSNPDWLFQK